MAISPRRSVRPMDPRWSSFPNAPYGLVVGDTPHVDPPRRSIRQPEVLSLRLAGGKTLPVFGSERDAARFAEAWNQQTQQSQQLADFETKDLHEGWRGRGTGTGELISLLSGSAFEAGPGGGVERIVLDPPMEVIAELRRGAVGGRWPDTPQR